jgi:HD-like signal output (HDOD) protein
MSFAFLDTTLLPWLILLLAVSSASMTFFLRSRKKNAGDISQPQPLPAAVAAGIPNAAAGEADSFSEPLLATLSSEIHRRAFATRNFNYSFTGEHREVLKRVQAMLPEASTSRQYIPRKPQIIPRLLSMMRNDKVSRDQLVNLLLEDPQLSADLLKLANSPAYRLSGEVMDNIGRAVALLGTEGLRSLVASAVMQPMFQVQKGHFDTFAPTIWNFATRSARAAQDYARLTIGCDQFNAHMATLLNYIAHIVLFRVAIDQYDVAARGSRPRAEVIIGILDACNDELALGIARNWELPDDIIAGLEGYRAKGPVKAMHPVARALYYGRVCGAAAQVIADTELTTGDVFALLERQGMDASQIQKLWRKLMAEAA